MFLSEPFYQYYLDYAKGFINTQIQAIEVNKQTENNKSKLIKDIKKRVSKEYNLNNTEDKNIKIAISEYRFVTVDCLNVRINNSTKSKAIYKLNFGEVTRIINKNRNWTFIEYSDDENINIKGWVYTRYLSKFK
ncbi:SH3 domain-containing protein [Haloimpatiens sp. FM7330]|uniref:SH3 domain-containing protein n=1 Tax=Haloimpatiens sp. FM7330 TaxID=3298610 RepID=UPI00362C3DE1